MCYNMGLLNVRFALIFFICLLLTSFAFCAKGKSILQKDGHGSFSYDPNAENGPENWGNLNPDWEACGVGKSQSPINIQNSVISPVLGDLINTYKPGLAILKLEPHDVTVEWEEDAGGIIINDTYYKLLKCHWHTPSEHTFHQQRYAAELHLVHQNADGDIAVVGFLYKCGPSDPFLQWILSFLISHESDLGQVNPLWIGFDDRAYYRYNGSLTTPPCSENVTWTLFQRVRTISLQQVELLGAAIEDGQFGNARPLQALNGRIPYSFQPTLLSSI